MLASLLVLAPFLAHHARAQYSATYTPGNTPPTTQEGQEGTNQCGTGFNQTSECQNAYINTVLDWCIWAPPESGAASVVGNTERIEVAWCLQNGTGNRLIPDGTITGAHLVVTPDYVQVTGVGNLTHINVPAGDAGGELDPHGADGNGNPVGGLVFSSAFGPNQQIHEWTNFVSDTEFCFRACKPGPSAPDWCQHTFDTLGCEWNMPANYAPGVFEQCLGDSGQQQGAAHPAPASSSCTTYSTIGNGLVYATPTSSTSSSRATASTSSTGSSGSPTKAPSSNNANPLSFSARGIAGWVLAVAGLIVAI